MSKFHTKRIQKKIRGYLPLRLFRLNYSMTSSSSVSHNTDLNSNIIWSIRNNIVGKTQSILTRPVWNIRSLIADHIREIKLYRKPD